MSSLWAFGLGEDFKSLDIMGVMRLAPEKVRYKI